ncbi:hypothetical protein EDB87DRAFT_1169296 [Lactarius vividus]|nr:hypothetical protein EDB87DRAFT_1169296 [Lactarius vividus]
MSQSASSTRISLSIYPAMSAGGFCIYESNRTSPSSLAQPIPFDSDGQMRIDLLGLQPGFSQLRMWKNVWNASDPPVCCMRSPMPPSPGLNVAFPTLIAMPL